MGWQPDRNEWPSQVTSIVAVFIVGGFLKQNVSEIKLANTEELKQLILEKTAHCYFLFTIVSYVQILSIFTFPSGTSTWWTPDENVSWCSTEYFEFSSTFNIEFKTFKNQRSLQFSGYLGKGFIKIHGSNGYHFRMNAFWGSHQINGHCVFKFFNDSFKVIHP